MELASLNLIDVHQIVKIQLVPGVHVQKQRVELFAGHKHDILGVVHHDEVWLREKLVLENEKDLEIVDGVVVLVDALGVDQINFGLF